MDVNSKKRGEYIREKILQAIIGYIEQHGYAPTYREIAEMVGLKSKCTINTHIKRMMIEGKLETDAEEGAPRAIRVPGYKFVKEGTEEA